MRISDYMAAASANIPAPIASNRTGGNVSGAVSLLSNYEFWLTMCVMIFGVFSLVLSNRALHNSKDPSPEHYIRIVAVNLIVVGTLITITAGLSDQQIAPAFGLFGTIAGYLLGRSERSDDRGRGAPAAPPMKAEVGSDVAR